MKALLPLTLMFISSILIWTCKEDKNDPAGPTISGFSPAGAQVGETVTITGSNFGSTNGANIIKFNGTVASIMSSSSSQITTKVPTGATTGKISVTVAGITSVSSGDFTVLGPPPTITDFTPTSGIAGNTIMITGTNFSLTVLQNVVKFNGSTATITAASETTLVVKVPADAVKGKISVSVQGQEVFSAGDFSVLPVFTSFSPLSGGIGASVTISGSGFSPMLANNVVKLGTLTATVTNASPTALTVTVPANAVTSAFEVTVDGNVAISGSNFKIILEVVSGGGTGYDESYSATTDADGNVFIAGSFIDAATFGNYNLTGTGEEIFVAKYDSTLSLQWAISAGGADPDRAMGISVDASGNAYITGYCSTGAVFGTHTSSETVPGIFIAKISSTGSVSWLKTASNYDGVHFGLPIGMSISVDATGGVVASGHFVGTINLGTTDLISAGDEDIFVAKLNETTGAEIWAVRAGATGSDTGTGVAVDASGTVYLSGSFSGSVSFGTTTLHSAGMWDGLVAKLSSSGTFTWAKSIAGTAEDSATSITVSGTGDCFVTGYFTGSSSIGSANLNSEGNADGFVARFNKSNGSTVWATKIGGTDYDLANGIHLDGTGHVFVTGYFTGSVTFGTQTYISVSTSRDIFLSKLSESTGAFQKTTKAGSTEDDYGYGISASDHGNVMLTGSFRSTVVFRTTPLSSGNLVSDAYLWKIKI